MPEESDGREMKGTAEQVTALQPRVRPTDFLEIQMRPAEDLISLNPSTCTGLWVMRTGTYKCSYVHVKSPQHTETEIITELMFL